MNEEENASGRKWEGFALVFYIVMFQIFLGIILFLGEYVMRTMLLVSVVVWLSYLAYKRDQKFKR